MLTLARPVHGEAALVEACLPCHLLVLAAEDIRRKGWELRPDVHVHLNRAAAVPLACNDALTISRIARRVDEAASELLRDLAPDDPRDCLLTCARFILKLVDEGFMADPGNQSVLVALHLAEDAKNNPEWRYHEARVAAGAAAMLRRANLLGLFLKTG